VTGEAAVVVAEAVPEPQPMALAARVVRGLAAFGA